MKHQVWTLEGIAMQTMNTRREFLRDATCLFATAGFGRVFAAAPGLFTAGKPNLTFGVLSDIHIHVDGEVVKGPAPEKDLSLIAFRNMLELFRDGGADAVAIAGDLANTGLVSQLRRVAKTWFEVFPDDRAPDGRKVERVFVYGNHDASEGMARRHCPDEAAMKANALALDQAKWWKEVFHEDYAPVYRKTVKGYDFIGAHWKGNCRGMDDSFCKDLESFYAEVGPKLDPKKPFFHIQHPHPKGTVHGPGVWGQDDGVSVKVLSNYPNAIAFSGHSHNSLLDERAIWQGAFTSVATGTTYTIGSSALPSGVPWGFENGKTGGGKKAAAYDHVRVMPPIARGLGRQGQLVRVYDDRIVFSRFDALTKKPLAEDLVMPLPAADRKPFAFAPREAAAKAPEFPAGAAVSFVACESRRRDAKKGDAPVPCLAVSVPAAIGEPSAVGVRYRIVATGEGAEPLELAVLHDAYRFGLSDKRARAPLTCPIALERLPKGKVRFAVTAYSWWGKASATLEAVHDVGA